jgi:transcription elongation factor GreA-like protein
VALYVSGSLTLKRHSQEDNINLLNLIQMFIDIKKWNIVEYLCQKILSVSQNRHALRLLATCYQQQGEVDKMFATYEQVIKRTTMRFDIVKQLAERAKARGIRKKPSGSPRSAFERNLNKHDITARPFAVR